MSQSPLSSLDMHSRTRDPAPAGRCSNEAVVSTAASVSLRHRFFRELSGALAALPDASSHTHAGVSSLDLGCAPGNRVSCESSPKKSEPYLPAHVVEPNGVFLAENNGARIAPIKESITFTSDTTCSARAIMGWVAMHAVEILARRRRARLRLESLGLGSVCLDLYVRGGSVHLGIEASLEAMAAIQSETHVLDDELGQRGLRLVSVSVRSWG